MSQAHITRLESRVGLGIPDCIVAIPERGFVWVELKVVNKGKKVKLSPHQVSFHIKHALLGCPTYILVAYYPPTKSVKKPQILLYEGKDVEAILTHGVEARASLSTDLTPCCWDMIYKRFYLALE